MGRSLAALASSECSAKSARKAGQTFFRLSRVVAGSGVRLTVARQLPPQPGPRVGPGPLRRARRDAEVLGDLVDRHAREDAELDQIRRLRVHGGQLGEGFVQVEQVVADRRGQSVVFMQLIPLAAAAVALAALAP